MPSSLQGSVQPKGEMRKVSTATRDPTQLGIEEQRTTLLEKSAAEELVQMLAQDVADEDASAGRGQPGRASALVDLDQGAPFEGDRLLVTKTALGDQRVAKFRHHWRKTAIRLLECRLRRGCRQPAKWRTAAQGG